MRPDGLADLRIFDKCEFSPRIELMPRVSPVGPETPAGGLAVGEVGRRPWVLHPFLIGIFPIVSLYSHNVYETGVSAMAWPVTLTLSSTLVVWLVMRLISGDAAKAGLGASLLVASFFGFKEIERACTFAWIWICQFWVYNDPVMNPLVVLAILSIADGAVLFVIFRGWGRPVRWTPALNIFTLILVALPAFGAVSARMREPAATHRKAALPAVAKHRGWMPDIYFIVLDGYARGDVMKELFGFDNGPFLDRLERRGFFVARRSDSNYCQTRLSIASTLNANYLDKLVDRGNSDLLPLVDLIKDNLVRKSLQPLGYRFVSFATGFEATDLSDADVYLGPGQGRPEFSQILIEMTPIDAWYSEVKHNDRYVSIRARTQFVLDRLPSVARMDGPTFTFAHILGPHPPFVFGKHGEDVSPRRILANGRYKSLEASGFGTPNYFRDAYRDQSVYLTERIERTIDQILAQSPEPPVIILQSDHGSWLRYHPDDVEATDLHERFGILNCVYMPGRKDVGLSDTMTSVNTFRFLLKEMIEADLPPLPDRNYFSPFHAPLDFTDVTERLHSPGERERKFTYPEKYYGLEQQF
jgi:hypothetical protein